MNQQRADDDREQHLGRFVDRLRRADGAVELADRDESAEHAAAPHQVGEQPLRRRIVEADEAARRIVRREHAGGGRARERRNAGADHETEQQAPIVRRNQLELIEQRQRHGDAKRGRG